MGMGVGWGLRRGMDRLLALAGAWMSSALPMDTDGCTSLIRSGAAIPLTAHASPPTVTMPRVKALTTGSVPSFLDLILNFAESDTSSSLALQDTWLAQIREKSFSYSGGGSSMDDADGSTQTAGQLVFYGDDTWLKLFPSAWFARHDGTSSFFVSVSKTGPGIFHLVEHVAEYESLFLRRISQKLITT